MPKIEEVVALLRNYFPEELQEDWDNSGPFKIFPEEEVELVVVSLDPVEGVFHYAKKIGSKLVVTHHPFTLKPLKNLNLDPGKNKIIELIFLHRISLYSLHTNFDWAFGGMNDIFCRKIGLSSLKPIESLWMDGFKLVTFFPKDFDVKVLLKEMDRKGLGGRIGNYTMCSFRGSGIGSFFPMDSSSPAVGEKGRLNEVDEIRFEMRVLSSHLDDAYHLIKTLHPYEEPPIEFFPIKFNGVGGKGRVGEFQEAITFKELLERISDILGEKRVSTIGRIPEKVKRVGVCLGRGISLYKSAVSKDIDIFITGDLTYHDRELVSIYGVPILDVGHEAEMVGLSGLKEVLEKIVEVHIYGI